MWKYRTSQEPYVDKYLQEGDAIGYTAAGLLPYKMQDGVPQLLLTLEKPWNALTDEYDDVSLALFGGKRGPAAQEWESHVSGARWLLDPFGVQEGMPSKQDLATSCLNGFAAWYPRGKYALHIFEVADKQLPADIVDRLARASKEGAQDPNTTTKYKKAIEEIKWVSGADLLAKKTPLSNLLENIVEIEMFKGFLEGKLDVKSLGDGKERPVTGKGKGKDSSWGKGKGGKGKGKDKGGSWGKGGFAKGGWGGPPMFPVNQFGYFFKGGKDKGGGKAKGKGGKGFPPGPAAYMPPQMMQSEYAYPEIQRQMIGEQLFALVQPMVATPFLAQKVTGMLLELPQQEQLPLLHIPQELKKRVDEATLVLKDDGLDVA